MRIVLDTNILVSGLLCPYGAPGKIVRMIASGTLQLCYDARIITEYKDVLSRPKFSFDKAHIDALITQIKFCGLVIAATPLLKRLPDQDDEAFLEVALAGKARCLVTGNLKHYPLKLQQNVTVITPPELLELYCREQEK